MCYLERPRVECFVISIQILVHQVFELKIDIIRINSRRCIDQARGERLLDKPLAVVIKRVLVARREGHNLEPQNQIVSGRDVVVVPYVHDIGVLSVQNHVRHKVDRPLDRAECRLALPSLVVLAVHYSKRADEILHNVNNAVQIIHLVRPSAELGGIEVMHQRVPLCPYLRHQRAYLQACQDVVKGRQIDERIDGGAQPGPLQRLVGHSSADLRIPVQPHDKREITLVHWMAQSEIRRVGRLWQPKGGNDLLDPVGYIKVSGLARQEPRLPVGIGCNIPQQTAVVIDPRVRALMQRRRQSAQSRQGALVHDHLGSLYVVDASEKV